MIQYFRQGKTKVCLLSQKPPSGWQTHKPTELKNMSVWYIKFRVQVYDFLLNLGQWTAADWLLQSHWSSHLASTLGLDKCLLSSKGGDTNHSRLKHYAGRIEEEPPTFWVEFWAGPPFHRIPAETPPYHGSLEAVPPYSHPLPTT